MQKNHSIGMSAVHTLNSVYFGRELLTFRRK